VWAGAAGAPNSVTKRQHRPGAVCEREHRASILTAGALVRWHASQEGNAVAMCARLGLARDPRAELLAESLVR
jgi:hypothetical protein